jgi:choline dehydrogenase
VHEPSSVTGTVVVGGGTAGAAIAGRLTEAGEEVLLIEAGPDFGRVQSGHWPERLLDPSLMPIDLHSWSYISAAAHGLPNLDLQRAKVIGGCSSHNGCAVVWSHRDDYDSWEAQGNPGWDTDGLLPYLQMGNERFRVFTPEKKELTPFHQAVLEAAPGAGYPFLPDLTDLDINHGLGIGPVNISDGLRWNAAFAYLDPVRDAPNLTILSDTLVDRLVIEDGRVTGVEVIGHEGAFQIEAARVILAGGAYGTPLILQRSGIGDPDDFSPFGIAAVHELPGVGKNLQDHPAIAVSYSGTPELTARLDAFVNDGGMPREEGTIALASSSRCEGPFDLHIYPIAHRHAEGNWEIFIAAAVMSPKSAGFIKITDADPAAAPLIDHCYLTDPDGYDLEALIDAVGLIRELASQEPLKSLLGEETSPGSRVVSRKELEEMLPTTSSHDYHPTSTCKMGPASDRMTVVDQQGRIHGLDGVVIGDASIMPAVPMANTNLPALAVAEKIAAMVIYEGAR